MLLSKLFRDEARANLAIAVPPILQLRLPVDTRLGLVSPQLFFSGLFAVLDPWRAPAHSSMGSRGRGGVSRLFDSIQNWLVLVDTVPPIGRSQGPHRYVAWTRVSHPFSYQTVVGSVVFSWVKPLAGVDPPQQGRATAGSFVKSFSWNGLQGLKRTKG